MNGYQPFADALPETSITELRMASASLGNAGAAVVSRGLAASRVKVADLSGNDIEGAGVTPIITAAATAPIGTLILCWNRLGPAGAEAISRELPKTELIDIDLTNNGLGDDGAQHIGPVLADKKSSVARVNFTGNGFGDRGAQSIAPALSNPVLTHINLSGNEIRDKGVQALSESVTEPQSAVVLLNLTNNEFGAEGIKALKAAKEAKPQIDITH